MKKNLFSILGLALGILAIGSVIHGAQTLPTKLNPLRDTSPYVSKYGSKLKSNSVVVLGGPNADTSCIGFEGVAIVSVTAGDVLIGVSSTAYPRAVSKSATGGVASVIGVAMTDAAYGVTLTVCQKGFAKVVADPGLVITYDMFLVNSAVGGTACGVSQVADDFARAVSQTAIIGRSKQVITTTTTNKFVDVELLNH